MDDRRQRFEDLALPHLDAAYNLARWLSRSPADADDIVQDAMLRAFRGFDGFRGGDVRAWLLTIVRNCWKTCGKAQKRRGHEELDEGLAADAAGPEDAAMEASRRAGVLGRTEARWRRARAGYPRRPVHRHRKEKPRLSPAGASSCLDAQITRTDAG